MVSLTISVAAGSGGDAVDAADGVPVLTPRRFACGECTAEVQTAAVCGASVRIVVGGLCGDGPQGPRLMEALMAVRACVEAGAAEVQCVLPADARALRDAPLVESLVRAAGASVAYAAL